VLGNEHTMAGATVQAMGDGPLARGHLFSILKANPLSGSRFPESRFTVVMMNTTQYLGRSAMAAWAEEIERAIDKVKRTQRDKRFKREWHKADARRQWSADRQARWEDWRARRSRGVAQHETGQPKPVPVTPSKVWVRGRVPREFLDWVERQEGSGPEEREMLAECFLEEWQR